MMLYWGASPYGKCDHVPGLFYVSTDFLHLQFVPLLPLRSRLVFEKTVGENASGSKIPIPMSIKSVLLGWLRFLIVASLIGLIAFGLLPGGGRGKRPAGHPITPFVTGAALIGFLCLSYRIFPPSPERILDLADLAVVSPEEIFAALPERFRGESMRTAVAWRLGREPTFSLTNSIAAPTSTSDSTRSAGSKPSTVDAVRGRPASVDSASRNGDDETHPFLKEFRKHES